MSGNDLDADLMRCKQMLEAAAKCYWSSKFDQSEELYRAALSVLETVYATDSIDIATCLQGLGDSYYFQNKFGLALPYYTRLLASRERMLDTAPSEYVAALFKVAKTQDRLGNFLEADQSYKRATTIAQKMLVLGHPLYTSLLEGYAKFLKRYKPGTEHAIEQQATLSREKYVDPEMLNANILEGVGAEKSAKQQESQSRTKDKIWLSTTVADESDNRLVKFLIKIKDNPKLVYAVLFAPIYCSFAVLVATVVYQLAVDDPQLLVHAGDAYQTADGHKRLTFTTRDKVTVESNGVGVERKYHLLSNRWRELASSFFDGSTAPWTVKTGDRLVTSNGVVLLPSNEAAAQMAPILSNVAQHLYEALDVSEDPDKLKPEAYNNPYTNLYTIPLKKVCRVETSRGAIESLHQGITSSMTYEEFCVKCGKIVGPVLRSDTIKDGTVVCLITTKTKSDGDTVVSHFFVFGVGRDGDLIWNCKHDGALLYTGAPKLAPVASCSGSADMTDPTIIISDHSKESYTRSKLLLAWDLLLLVPFIIATFAFQNQLNAKKYSDRTLNSRQTLLQVAVLLYGTFAFMYGSFTLYVLYCLML